MRCPRCITASDVAEVLLAVKPDKFIVTKMRGKPCLAAKDPVVGWITGRIARAAFNQELRRFARCLPKAGRA